jgi:S1-C subfamily serine protease/predicted esterase
MKFRILLAVILATATATVRAQDLNDQLERMTKDAVKKVAPAVVQIVTQGGIDMVVTSPKGPVFRKAMGPTTGVIVDTEGYIISSAFNFVNSPTVILVAVPGQAEPYVAKLVATDKSRLLTLLKVETKGLPVPSYVPKKDIVEGQWSIALGRTLDAKRAHLPSISVGIISATGRIWGKALQTDAKISPINYGGPIVDIEGRVQGILVPASPQGEDVTAGFEWYDSGIGFAIPMEDVLAAVPRLKEGKDLKKGLLGIRMKSGDMYGALPEIGEVTHESAASKAGLKPGDVIMEIEGKPVMRMAQILHTLGAKYEGDKISLKYKRGKDVIAVNDLKLVGQLTVTANAYLGILPMRDDPKLGVEVRHVFPKSPADKAGIKAGDRILKYGTAMAQTAFTGAVSGREELLGWLNAQTAGTEIKLEVKTKDGKAATLTATLDTMPGTIIGQEAEVADKLPEVASHKKALAPLETSNPNVKPAKVEPNPNMPETGLLKRNTPDGEHKYWVYVHEDYDPNIAHGLIVWLHPPGKNKDADVENITDAWSDYCKENHLIMVCPKSENEAGWVPSEAEYVIAAVRETQNQYTIDRQRVVAHGLGVGGQMALYLGFSNRDFFRGVATTAAVVTQPKDNIANQRLAFYLAGGELDPLIKSIADSRTQLQERKFPVVFREIKGRGREYFEDAQIREVVRWIDSLDVI